MVAAHCRRIVLTISGIKTKLLEKKVRREKKVRERERKKRTGMMVIRSSGLAQVWM